MLPIIEICSSMQNQKPLILSFGVGGGGGQTNFDSFSYDIRMIFLFMFPFPSLEPKNVNIFATNVH
jgi:hypothetical protein